MMRQWAGTMWLLGTRLLLHLLALPFRRDDLGQLVLRYRDDGLLPLSAADLEMQALLGLCDGCGLCDSGCALNEARPPTGLSPSQLVLSLSRSLPQLVVSAADLEPFRGCAACQGCRGWCPKGIPVDQVPGWCAALLRRFPQGDGEPPKAGGA